MKKLNKKRSLIILIAWIFIFQTSGTSCDCLRTTDVFIDELCITPLIIHGKVIKHIDWENENTGYSDFLGITLIEVMSSFKGGFESDTIVHINTDPTSCGLTIEDLDENQEIFLKGDFYNTFDYVGEGHYLNRPEQKANNNNLIFELRKKYQNIKAIFCEPSVIPIIEGHAIGEIDYIPREEWRIYIKLLKENTEKAYKYRRENIKEQKLPIEEVYTAIRETLKCDR